MNEPVQAESVTCDHVFSYSRQADFPPEIPWIGSCMKCGYYDARDQVAAAEELRTAREDLESERRAVAYFDEQSKRRKDELDVLRVALRYIASPTMGLPAGFDAYEFALDGVRDDLARLALQACIRTARGALETDAHKWTGEPRD